MWETIFDIIIDALMDSLKMLPFLFVAYLLLEYIEHKAGNKLSNTLQKLGPFGPVGGALIGCIPQCGFSVAASNLYAGRIITVGTLMSVFISTSDEAIPVILAHPDKFAILWKLIVIKIIIAVVFGILIDLLLKFILKSDSEEPQFEEICAHCGCEHGIFLSALKHTVNIFVFILAINLLLNTLFTLVGQENVSDFLMRIKLFQPLIAGLIGLVPNCAASVIITELYLNGGLTFGSMIAGLSTGAGLGLVVLFKANKNIKQNLYILGGLFFIGVFMGIILDLTGVGI